MASAAEARAAGRRMYADALRSKERLEAKRQEQQDLEALEDLQNQRVSWFFRTPEKTMRFYFKYRGRNLNRYISNTKTSSGMIKLQMMNNVAIVASKGPFWDKCMAN